jgi:RNA polymerase sigma-70 factor (ECF subfamily)
MCFEADLLVRTARGDVVAFEELAEKYYGPLYSFFYRMLMDNQYSENLVQETFLRMFRYSGSFDPSRKASSWIFSIASNVVKDWTAKKSTSMEIPFDNTAFPQKSEKTSVLDQVANNYQGEQILKALAKLDEKHRKVFLLKHFHHLRYHEIALIMGTAEGTVKSRMHFACKQLQKLLPGYEEF